MTVLKTSFGALLCVFALSAPSLAATETVSARDYVTMLPMLLHLGGAQLEGGGCKLEFFGYGHIQLQDFQGNVESAVANESDRLKTADRYDSHQNYHYSSVGKVGGKILKINSTILKGEDQARFVAFQLGSAYCKFMVKGGAFHSPGK